MRYHKTSHLALCEIAVSEVIVCNIENRNYNWSILLLLLERDFWSENVGLFVKFIYYNNKYLPFYLFRKIYNILYIRSYLSKIITSNSHIISHFLLSTSGNFSETETSLQKKNSHFYLIESGN